MDDGTHARSERVRGSVTRDVLPHPGTGSAGRATGPARAEVAMSEPVIHPLPLAAGGLGVRVALDAVASAGWRTVQATLDGALALLEGGGGGAAVAWCGVLPEAGQLAVVFTWAGVVEEATLQAVLRAMAAGVRHDVVVVGVEGPQDGWFPTLARLGGVTAQVWLPEQPAPVVVWPARDADGAWTLRGAPEATEEAGFDPSRPGVILGASPPLDRDEALFLLHAAARLAQVVRPDGVVAWMRREVAPVLADEGLIDDAGGIDTEAVREAVVDALEALRTRPPEARRALVVRLAESLGGETGIDEAAARELALVMRALEIV